MGEKNLKKEEKRILKIEEMPLPIFLAIRGYENETESFRKVHRLIDAIEVFIKFHTVCIMSRFFEKEEISDKLKSLLVKGLKTPSLGIWWEFTREFAKELDKNEVDPFFKAMIKSLKKKGDLFKELQSENNLISFRNYYAHGSTPNNEKCLEDINKYSPVLLKLCEKAEYFRGISLLGWSSKELWQSDGGNISHIKTSKVEKDGCFLKLKDKSEIQLHPLLIFRKEKKGRHFFFYNDLRDKHVSLLNYEECIHRKEVALREEFLEVFRLNEWKKEESSVKNYFDDKIELLTETFKGRKEELEKLIEFLSEKKGGYLMIWGGPGVGKSSLLARVVQMFSWSEDVRREAGIKGDISAERMHIVEYFIRRDMGTNKAEDLLDHLYKRLDNMFKTGISQGKSLKEKEDAFKKQLKAVSKKLPDNERLVLIIDGLDEALEYPQLLDALPREYIDKLLIIYASRDKSEVRNIVYDKLEREKHQQMTLTGLEEEDTRALLYKHINKYELEEDYVTALTKESEGNPLYIKLICQGLEDKLYELNDSISLPNGFRELYDNIIKKLKKSEKNGRPFDILMILAAGKDYFSRDMLTDVMKEDSELAIHSCMELLIENPLTEKLLDYQLFHESLREYLVKYYKADLKKWQSRLSEWCHGWEDLDGDKKKYALEYLIDHLAISYSYAEDKTDGNEQEAKKLLNEMIKAVENKEFREKIFLACGNDEPLKRGLSIIQGLLAKTDKNGSNMVKFFKYSRMMHEERGKMEKQQLKKIVKEAMESNLENITQFAKMGSTTRDNLMLTIRALWEAPQKTKIPLEMRETTKKWLGEISDPVMDKLMDISLKRFDE